MRRRASKEYTTKNIGSAAGMGKVGSEDEAGHAIISYGQRSLALLVAVCKLGLAMHGRSYLQWLLLLHLRACAAFYEVFRKE